MKQQVNSTNREADFYCHIADELIIEENLTEDASHKQFSGVAHSHPLSFPLAQILATALPLTVS
jgi:hypothetical protein